MQHLPQNVAVYLAQPYIFPGDGPTKRIPAGEFSVRRCGTDEATGFLDWVEVDFRVPGIESPQLLSIIGGGLVTRSYILIKAELVRPGYSRALGVIETLDRQGLVDTLRGLYRQTNLGAEAQDAEIQDVTQALNDDDLRAAVRGGLAIKYTYPSRPAIKAAR